jgi:hypothetical protein
MAKWTSMSPTLELHMAVDDLDLQERDSLLRVPSPAPLSQYWFGSRWDV